MDLSFAEALRALIDNYQNEGVEDDAVRSALEDELASLDEAAEEKEEEEKDG